MEHIKIINWSKEFEDRISRGFLFFQDFEDLPNMPMYWIEDTSNKKVITVEEKERVCMYCEKIYSNCYCLTDL